jgi:heat shock protein HslJ
MSHTTSRAGVIASLALVAAGCGQGGDEGGDEGGEAPGGGTPLAGRTFVVTDLEGAPFRLGPGVVIRLEFDEDAVGAYAGCNHMSGRFDQADDLLVVDALGSTEMACDPPLMARDAWVSDLLTSRPTYAVDDSELTLVRGDTTVRLDEVGQAEYVD